jgi:hypothetical protein
MSAGLSAAAIGGIAAGVGAIGGAVISGSAAKSAANTQAQAANDATQAQLQMYNTTVGNEQPFINEGQNAMGTLNGELSGLTNPMSILQPINATNWQQYMSPAYNFQLQQGTQALQNSQAAGDGVLSGSALKGLINYNQNFAQTGFNNAANLYMGQQNQQFNQYQTQQGNIYNRLSGLVQLGQNAASNTGMVGAGMAGGIANTITGAGNAAAAGTVGTANAVSGGLNNGMGYLMLNGLTNGNLFAGAGGANPGVPDWTPPGT